MRRLIVLAAPVLLLFAAFQLPGCMDPGSGVSAELLSKHQAMLVLAEEPEEGLQTVADVRDALLGVGEEPHDHDHEGHDHEGHDHEGHDHDGHDHEGHDHDGHDHDGHDHDGHDHDGHDHDAAEHAGHDHEGHDHEGHEGHDHDALPTKRQQVVMVGTVGGLTNPWAETQPDYPFAKQQAMLFVCDSGTVAEQEASGHVHAPGEECAFCARHAGKTVDMIAMVRFVDEDGKTVAIDAKQLFNVDHMDTVVITGTAHIDRGGLLIVEATGLYPRK